MQHHRTPFTSSRFVTDAPTEEPNDTVFTYSRDAAENENRYSDRYESGRYESGEYEYADDNRVPEFDVWKRNFDETRERRSVPASFFLNQQSQAAPSAPSGRRRAPEPLVSEQSTTTRMIITTPAAADVLGSAFPVDVATVGVRRSGAHRIPAPPSALKGRVAVIAVAAGAVVAAGQAALNDRSGAAEPTDSSEVALASAGGPVAAAAITTDPVASTVDASGFLSATSTGAPVSAPSNSAAPQILNVAAPAQLGQFSALLEKGQKFSEEREAREAEARRPLFVLPAHGTFTSNFGSRWGVLHAGVDIANAIGTPIYAVADGKVIDSGPASGFGLWIRLLHADGTITVYGHIDSSEVTVGQTVMAGDEIAKMGNRGESTGPHLHFEVHLPGENKIDPLPWLATRGISLGPETD